MLQGGFLAGSAVVLCAPSSDEVLHLLKGFLKAETEGRSLFVSRGTSVSDALQTDCDRVTFLVCGEHVHPSGNVLGGKGLENLTELSLEITETINRIQPKRLAIDIASDLLLRHGPLQTRKWFSEQLSKLKSRRITTFAILNSSMHTQAEISAVADLFDGDLEIIEKEQNGQPTSFLRVRWMHGITVTETEPIALDLIQPSVKIETCSPSDLTAQASPLIAREKGLAEERRLTTVLFSDLVDSTALSFELDPEELKKILREYLDVCTQTIGNHGGYLAKYLPDGILAYFGYPEAHEDDAVEAVRAGLEIVSNVKALNGKIHQPKTLKSRVGIHTGTVVAGEMSASGRPEPLSLVGDAVNLAMRLQEAARPDSVVVSESTRRLVSDFFELSSLGKTELKEIPHAVAMYSVEQELPVTTRLEATGQLTPFVGRGTELEFLMNYWRLTKSERGQVILILGEAGIGKSRLALEFRKGLGDEEYGSLEARASERRQNTPFYPLIDMINRACKINISDSRQVKLEKLNDLLTDLGLQAKTERFAEILSIGGQVQSEHTFVSTERRKKLMMEALTDFVFSSTKKNPLVLQIEDLHWMDDFTMEFLEELTGKIGNQRLFVLVSARPEVKFDVPLYPNFHQIALSRMNSEDTEGIARASIRDNPLPAYLMGQIVQKSEGIPLCAEEMAKTAAESTTQSQATSRPNDSRRSDWVMPSTLQGSLIARLDRIGGAKILAQVASVVGREFTTDMLRALKIFREEEIEHGIGILLDKGIIYQRGRRPVAGYVFKHALIQEAAYDLILKSRRQELHRMVANAYLEKDPDIAEFQPETIAYHFTEAGLNERAIPFWLQAGRKALERSAHSDAVTYLSRGLRLIESLPDSASRDGVEFDFLATIGPALISAKGYASPEVEKVYLRCVELSQHLADSPKLFVSLFGLLSCYILQGDLGKARQFAERCLELAKQTSDIGFELEASSALGQTLFYLGSFSEAETALKRAISLYDPRKYGDHAFTYGEDPGVGSRVHLSWALWSLGHTDQAAEVSEEAIELARSLSYPPGLVYALLFAAEVRNQRGEVEIATKYANEASQLSEEQFLPMFAAMVDCRLGLSHCLQGRMREAARELLKGIEDWRKTGAGLETSSRLCHLAKVYLADDKTQESLEALSQGLEHVKATGERYYESELHRTRGEALLTIGDVKGAEDCFTAALGIAREQQAKSLELRAAMSMSKHLLATGRGGEAKNLLLSIFPALEGSDTKDVAEAKALLARMDQ